MSPHCNSHTRRWSAVLLVMAVTGCASATPTSTDRDDVPYRADEHLQRVWLADGFSVQRYQSLLVLEPRADVPKLNPDGAVNLQWARGLLRDEVVKALRVRRVFPAVALTASEVAPGTPSLRMDTTIVEYEKGEGAPASSPGSMARASP